MSRRTILRARRRSLLASWPLAALAGRHRSHQPSPRPENDSLYAVRQARWLRASGGAR